MRESADWEAFEEDNKGELKQLASALAVPKGGDVAGSAAALLVKLITGSSVIASAAEKAVAKTFGEWFEDTPDARLAKAVVEEESADLNADAMRRFARAMYPIMARGAETARTALAQLTSSVAQLESTQEEGFDTLASAMQVTLASLSRIEWSQEAMQASLRRVESALGAGAKTPAMLERVAVPKRRPLPPRPYPGLLAYDDPRLFAGREQELSDFMTLLRAKSVLTIRAPSGAGKSSFIQACVIPALKRDGLRVVYERLPNRSPGPRICAAVGCPCPYENVVAQASALVQFGHATNSDGGEVVIFLDQFEDVFPPGTSDLDTQQTSSQQELALILSHTITHLPDRSLRWVLSYREEAHGAVESWLEDVFDGAGGIEKRSNDLVTRLLDPKIYGAYSLPVIGSQRGTRDLARSRRAFAQILRRPAEVVDVTDHAPWRLFSEEAINVLAEHFAAERVSHPRGALLPELQIVIDTLYRANESNPVEVPDDIAKYHRDAVRGHLEACLKAGWSQPRDRTRALIVLHRVAQAQLRGLRVPWSDLQLAFTILPSQSVWTRLRSLVRGPYGRDAHADPVLKKLEDLRLLVTEQTDDVTTARIPHDYLAEDIQRFAQRVAVAGISAADAIDRELLLLQRFVDERVRLFRDNDPESVLVSPERRAAIVEHHADISVDADWWRAVRTESRIPGLHTVKAVLDSLGITSSAYVAANSNAEPFGLYHVAAIVPTCIIYVSLGAVTGIAEVTKREGRAVLYTWAMTVAVLTAFAVATNVSSEYSRRVMLTWFAVTPIVLIALREAFSRATKAIAARKDKRHETHHTSQG